MKGKKHQVENMRFLSSLPTPAVKYIHEVVDVPLSVSAVKVWCHSGLSVTHTKAGSCSTVTEMFVDKRSRRNIDIFSCKVASK